MRAYDQSHGGVSGYASAPLPHYLEKLGVEVAASVGGRVQDVCYQLLKLYCDRMQPLHVLLNPPSITDNELDYSLRSAAGILLNLSSASDFFTGLWLT